MPYIKTITVKKNYGDYCFGCSENIPDGEMLVEYISQENGEFISRICMCQKCHEFAEIHPDLISDPKFFWKGKVGDARQNYEKVQNFEKKMKDYQLYKDLAKQCMEIIACDNDAVNRFEPMTYPRKHQKNIKDALAVFFKHNPELLDPATVGDMLSEICIGDENEARKKYCKLKGYKNLDNALNDYFDFLEHTAPCSDSTKEDK